VQVEQLRNPQLNMRELTVIDPDTGEERQASFITDRDVAQLLVEQIEVQAERRALEDLRRASFFALLALFFASFGAGYLLSGWALRPVNRITKVARDIGGKDLAERIHLVGPDDELKQLADTFDGMLDRIQDAFEDQRRFVQDASHELRNPLAVARTNLELALNSGDPQALEKGSTIALGATDRMSALVDDLLEQAREGLPDHVRTEVELGPIAENVASEFRAAAHERRLRICASAEAGVVVHGEGPALRRALSNLVANAVRLAPPGSTISIDVGVSDGWATMSVTDEGPGIPGADLDSVFQRFWRGDHAGPGTGLGLSIVRQIAERHGGRAEVTSEVGRGSTFTVWLPMPIPVS
jgi:signal transduction histidine kinase